MPLIDRLRSRARALKPATLALYRAVRDPHTPWHARLFVTPIVLASRRVIEAW